MDIVSLAQELERLRAAAVDAVVSTEKVNAVSENGVLTIEVPDYGRYPLTHWGHEQLAEKSRIPFGYYQQMLQEGHADLAATNVNTWLRHRAGDGKDKLLIRMTDQKVRAVLSNRYRMLDNYDLALLTMGRAKEHGAEVLRCDLTDQRMYIKLVVPQYKEYLTFTPQETAAHTWHEVGEDEVIPGLIVSNSEVGAGAFRVEPFLFRRACSNGCITDARLYQIHMGRELDIGQLIYSDETRQLEDKAIWSKVKDVIDSTFNPAVLKVLVDKMRAARGIPIENEFVPSVVDTVVKNAQLSKEHRDSLLAYFAKEGNTVFGIVNGMTRLAQDFASADDQVALERYAGKVLYAPELVVPAARKVA